MKPYILAAYNYLRLRWLRLGSNLVSDGRMVIMTDKQAVLSVGDRVYFKEGAMLSYKERISIGDNCVIGAGCVVKGEIPAGSLVTSSRELIIRPIRKESL